jgi:tetratricopeptide (TPR) repeat protein
MNRMVVASVAIAALVGVTVLGWFEVRQAREFRRLLAVGDAALAHDQLSVAIEAYSGAIALRKDSILGWLKRGDTYRRRGEFSPALRDLQQATALDPTAPRPIETLGDVYDAIGQHTRAVEAYSRFVALDDRSPRVLYKLALAHYRNGRSAAAIDPVRKALSLDRQMPEGHYLLGLAERDLKHPDRAIEAFSRAISLNPAFAAAREELAAVELSVGRRRDSLEQLDALAALEPERPDRLIRLALANARSGRFESAIVTLRRAVERFPDSAGVYRAVARVWLDFAEDGDDSVAVQKGVEALNMASVHDTGSPELLLLQGRAQLLSNAAAAAERSLQAATATLPVDPVVFKYLSTAAARLGHRELAAIAQARYAALTN